MRIKVLLSATLLALFILLPALYFRHGTSSVTPGQNNDVQGARQDGGVGSVPVASDSIPPRTLAPIHRSSAPSTVVIGSEASAEEHVAYVIQRKGELAQLGMSDDPAALKTILSELSNQDAEIRKAALNATVEFGSLDAIPALQNQFASTDDVEEKMEVKKAIEFLQLPHAHPDSSSLSQQTPVLPAADGN